MTSTEYAEPLYIVWRASGPQGTTAWQYGRSVEGWLSAPGYEDALRQQRGFVREHVRDTELVADGDRIQTKVLTGNQAARMGF